VPQSNAASRLGEKTADRVDEKAHPVTQYLNGSVTFPIIKNAKRKYSKHYPSTTSSKSYPTSPMKTNVHHISFILPDLRRISALLLTELFYNNQKIKEKFIHMLQIAPQ
jgi:hypothetical protein